MKSFVNIVIIGLAILAVALIGVHAFNNRNQAHDMINVTGLGKEDFASDLIVWRGSFTRKNMELKTAYADLNRDREAIGKYLIAKGVAENQIVFSSAAIEKELKETLFKDGKSTREFAGYLLTQNVQIESAEIEKIENVSREITELINMGIEFYSDPPEYYYTKLAELKIKMIASATQDALLRAKTIAAHSGGTLGKLRYAGMGVFQITAPNSQEEQSWSGTFNTASRMKTASITMKLQYQIK